MDLRVDPDRLRYDNCTGMYVRAEHAGGFGNYDIAQLDLPSLLKWLRSRGGYNIFAENVVARMLDHPVVDP